MKQASDFREEIDVLAAVLSPLDDSAFASRTLFKGWTISDVLGHLHMFDSGALLALEGDEKVRAFFAPLRAALDQEQTFLEAQTPWLNGLSGRALFDSWYRTAVDVADAYSDVDPKRRLKWAGPDMSARSFITARQMETWAHGQAVFDALGLIRPESDRIYNICHLGVSTFGWAFKNRMRQIPDQAPAVHLTAPSGAIWEWNAASGPDIVEGSAVDFARVVTQVRHADDTGLSVRGDGARAWIEIVQCFAGPPVDPPAPGSRYQSG